jgi:hypothetical protein
MTAQQLNQIERIKARPLGVLAPQVRDKRPAQKPRRGFKPPTSEQVKAAQENLGVGKAASEFKKEILVHDCFSQRHGYTKPLHCSCDTRIESWKARNLIKNGLADFLLYKRSGRELENRKSIVVTEEFRAKRAQAFDALNHQLPLSISEFTDYHMAPISSEASCGDARIDKVRFATIHQRKSEVRNRRDHRVGTANYRKGDGGMTVGTNTKDKYGNYKIVSAGNWKSGKAPDSDSSREDLLDGNGVGQVNSKKDREFGRGLDSVLNMNAGPQPAKGSLALKIEAARDLRTHRTSSLMCSLIRWQAIAGIIVA